MTMTDGGLCVPAVCYPFPLATLGRGACRAGATFCVGGARGPCIGAIGPSPESCNGIDDDCDGTADEAVELGKISCGLGACKVTVDACTSGQPTQCLSLSSASKVEVCDGLDNNCNGSVDEVGCGCVHVSPLGNDLNPGTAIAPLRTINAGIARSASDVAYPKIVCVAAGLNCSSADYVEAVMMKNGVSVYGGYELKLDGSAWPRCAPAVAPRISAKNPQGVLFDHNIVDPTIIDGFDIQAGSAPTNAALTVEGSSGAIINNNTLLGGAGLISMGADVYASNGATARPRFTRNSIVGGTGTARAIGIHSLNAAPVIQLNCGAIDANGRCINGGCGAFLTSGYIRGRTLNTSGGLESYGVFLENSPGALIQESAICSAQSSGSSAGVRITGNASGTIIRTSTIEGDDGAISSVGVLAEPCGGASPWLFSNFRISGYSSMAMSRADGVRAIGDCHVRVDSNRAVVGGDESSATDAIGVHCMRDRDAGISSQCSVLNNVDIIGSGGGIPLSSVGVKCDDGSCARVENNRITGRQGEFSAGVVLSNSGPVVSRNSISAGCGATGIGLVSRNSYARVENNVIRGSQCPLPNGPDQDVSIGVYVQLGAGNNELDLHSNDIFGEGTRMGGKSSGLAFDVVPGGGAAQLPAGARGIVRNNIIHSGVAPAAATVVELNALANPRLLEHNDLLHADGDGGVLYFDGNQASLTTINAVNTMLTATAATSNISADPRFATGTIKLTSGSPCRNTGTDAGAPLVDIGNDARPKEGKYDIGADEYQP